MAEARKRDADADADEWSVSSVSSVRMGKTWMDGASSPEIDKS
jgi:hypothetical protein